MNELFTLAEKLRALREEKDVQTAILKDINTDIKSVENQLSDAMTNAECSNFTHGQRQFILTSTKRWSPIADRKDELYAELRKQGHEHLFTVNSQTLASFIREQADEYAEEYADTHPDDSGLGEVMLPEWLAGLVKSYDDIGITMKSVTKKQK